MISIAPRAFRPKPMPNASFQSTPIIRAPSTHPTSLPTHATTSTASTIVRSKFAAMSTLRPMLAKKSGAKMKEMNRSIVVRVSSLRCGESPTAMPTR